MEEMNQVMRWTRTWPHLDFLLPPTILLCVITELAAGSNHQRCAEPGSNERAMPAARDAILTHGYHTIPNTHPPRDREKKHTAMFYSLYKNWGTQGLITETLQITDGEWKDHHHPEEPGFCLPWSQLYIFSCSVGESRSWWSIKSKHWQVTGN